MAPLSPIKLAGAAILLLFSASSPFAQAAPLDSPAPLELVSPLQQQCMYTSRRRKGKEKAIAHVPRLMTHDMIDIDADTLANLNLFEQFAAASYCPGNNNSTGDKLTCPSGNCPLVEADDVITVYEFSRYVTLGELICVDLALLLDKCLDLIMRWSVLIVLFGENSGLITGVTGYVAVDHTRQLTVVAFRGSHSLRNWAADLDFVQIPTFNLCFNCWCHQGL